MKNKALAKFIHTSLLSPLVLAPIVYFIVQGIYDTISYEVCEVFIVETNNGIEFRDKVKCRIEFIWQK